MDNPHHHEPNKKRQRVLFALEIENDGSGRGRVGGSPSWAHLPLSPPVPPFSSSSWLTLLLSLQELQLAPQLNEDAVSLDMFAMMIESGQAPQILWPHLEPKAQALAQVAIVDCSPAKKPRTRQALSRIPTHRPRNSALPIHCHLHARRTHHRQHQEDGLSF